MLNARIKCRKLNSNGDTHPVHLPPRAARPLQHYEQAARNLKLRNRGEQQRQNLVRWFSPHPRVPISPSPSPYAPTGEISPTSVQGSTQPRYIHPKCQLQKEGGGLEDRGGELSCYLEAEERRGYAPFSPNETEPLLADLAEAARAAVKKSARGVEESTGGVASPPGRGNGDRLRLVERACSAVLLPAQTR
jgi:hypothetical protein